MQTASDEMRFEDAGRFRDKIEGIRRVNRRRTLFFDDMKDREVIGLYKEDNRSAVALLKIVEGKLLAKETYKMKNVEKSSESEILSAFLSQYYESRLEKLPWRILLQIKPDDYNYLNGIFTE